MVFLRLVEIFFPDLYDIGQITVHPGAAGIGTHPQASAVKSASHMQDQGVFVLPYHFSGPVVKYPGPHGHVVGKPFGSGSAAEGKAFLLPDSFRGRVPEDDPLPADSGFTVKRDKKRIIYFVHSLSLPVFM
jgi:hypothetical protein